MHQYTIHHKNMQLEVCQLDLISICLNNLSVNLSVYLSYSLLATTKLQLLFNRKQVDITDYCISAPLVLCNKIKCFKTFSTLDLLAV